MDDPRSNNKAQLQASRQRAARRGIPRRVPEDVLEELHQLAGDVAAVFDYHDPEGNAALESFDKVMDALENKVN